MDSLQPLFFIWLVAHGEAPARGDSMGARCGGLSGEGREREVLLRD
jgi:hypothetical protein